MSKFVKKEWLLQAIKDLGIKRYTPIQNKTIPKILRKENCVGVSATGTGKTYCFVLPILENLEETKKTQAIIVLPTRELARQIYAKFDYFRKYYNFSLKLLIGGKVNDKFKNEQIIVSTPQKVIEFFQQEKPDLSNVKTIVFDEADMLIEKETRNVFGEIFEFFKNNKHLQKIAFSASLHEMLANQVAIYFKNTEVDNLSPSIWKNKNKIKHNLIHIDEDKQKDDILLKLVKDLNPYFCIIFANKKKEVDKIYKLLKTNNLDIIMLHGDLEARERKNVYKSIEQKTTRFLVATDLAARGLDILGVSHIISYNLPDDDTYFLHRIGRTGRIFQTGITYSFATKEDDLKIARLKQKEVDWNNLKMTRKGFEDYNYQFRRKPKRKKTEVDKEIKFIISTAPKKVKPNYKKKTQLKIKEVKRKAKRQAIEKSVKQNLIKKYKIENAKKGKKNDEI